MSNQITHKEPEAYPKVKEIIERNNNKESDFNVKAKGPGIRVS